jgi:hypothetical protein
MYSFELSAYTTDMDKLTYSWVENGQSVSSSVQMMDTPKFFWRCSFGTFAESGTDTVDNAASVTWRAPFPLKDLQDSVDISCTADDVAFIGEGEGGSRDDATASDSMSLPIRYPKTLTISHRWWTQADAATRPKDPGNAFGFFNIMHVDDNRGHPWAGMYIEQDMLRDDNGVYTATNGHPARPFGNPPLPREGDLVWWKDLNTTTTDANGDLYDLVQGESEQAYGTTPHIFKRVYVVSPDYGLTKYYWNPVPRNPACTSPHADQYSPLGPP